MATSSVGTNGPVAPSGAGTPPLEELNIVPVVLPPEAVPPAGYVTINIPICIPISCLPSGSLSPAARTDPNLAVSNPVVVPGVEVVRPTCEVQINNLVDMQTREGEDVGPNARKKLVALEALKEWKENQKGLEGKVERRTKQTDRLIYEIYQLVGLYSVFVGVVFAAVVQSQNLHCQHIWIPVLLCVVAWLIIILVTRKRLKRYNALRVTIKSEDKARAVTYLSSLPSSSFNDKSN